MKRKQDATANHARATGNRNGGTGLRPVRAELLITRRNLPHWQIGGSTYFITLRTQDLTLEEEARRIVINACRYLDAKRYTLWAAVVMRDHVHLLLQPKEIEIAEWWPLADMLEPIVRTIHREQVCQSPWIQCDDTTLDDYGSGVVPAQ